MDSLDFCGTRAFLDTIPCGRKTFLKLLRLQLGVDRAFETWVTVESSEGLYSWRQLFAKFRVQQLSSNQTAVARVIGNMAQCLQICSLSSHKHAAVSSRYSSCIMFIIIDVIKS